MSNTPSLPRDELLANITIAAHAEARGGAELVNALIAAKVLGTSQADLELYALQLRIGYVAESAGITDAESLAWLKSKAPKACGKDETPTVRQKAYNRATTAWARARDRAGFPKIKPVKAEKPQAIVADGSDRAASPAPPATSSVKLADAVKFQTVADVVTQLDEIAALVARIGNANAETLQGDAGMVVRDAIAAILTAVKAAHVAPAATVAPQAETPLVTAPAPRTRRSQESKAA
jgi:hypothetical protein